MRRNPFGTIQRGAKSLMIDGRSHVRNDVERAWRKRSAAFSSSTCKAFLKRGVVHDTAAQPSWGLSIGDDVHVAMLREEGLQHTQAVQEFAIVAVAAFNIAVSCKSAGVPLSP